MSTNIGYSSEIYFIEPQDLVQLPDCSSIKKFNNINNDKVVILLGNKNIRQSDSIVCGRDIIISAVEAKVSHIPVRFIFNSKISRWNILPIFFKMLRQKFKYENECIYHTTLTNLKKMNIERGVRTAENAYAISKRWHISPEERIDRYQKLVASLKENGFDDKYPISIMLCRRCGIKDSVDDGHHRIGVCADYNIERIAIKFKAAGALPAKLQKLILKII